MMKGTVVLSLLCLISISNGQFIQDGQCGDKDISLVTNFNVEDFTGTWYEVARSGDLLTTGDCSTITISQHVNEIIFRHVSVNNNFDQEKNYTATLESGTAKFTLNLDGRSVNYWIMLMDPDYYAIAYSCENIDSLKKKVHLWQLGKETALHNDNSLDLINTALNTNLGITIDQLDSINHSENACYRLSVIEEGQPIVIDGQCNSNLSVVNNFDVARFTGIWHEIASYWSENSFNSCPRAQYTLSDERVIVENSQVVNQTLLVINGYATVASTDGSAKLKVVLEVEPNVEAEQDLWVLSTDYENYAVVYTCVDLPEQQKRLYSWIVGRNHILTPEVQKTVDEVVDNYLELNRDYYRNSDQSSDACFYLPEPVPNTSVVFRGSCDLSIPVVSNFDAARYLGLWHNVESYPSTYQPGTCSNAFYSLNADGSVAVHNTQVINETLDTIDGYAVVASTDGTAKLSVTFPVADTNLTINTNYWVIDTDYDTYSLVYSCDDLPGNNKMVFGWKLSRTKELAANVSDKIDQAMSTVNVLNQRYFVDNDQSEDGCFYYPKPQPGVPVVFPGQCDDSIPVVNGFNLNQFEGVWHEIEAYPKDEQPGQCINHDYTVTGNSFTLDSSQIVDQLLVLYDSTVTFTSNDGSAKLNIAINSNNTVINIPFWILDTDYSDYALAYSCVNINDDFKGIWSWKLSRSKELSPEATNKINTFISSIPVLDNKYYEPVDQSDEACFYLPEQQPGKPVILDGQCDPNMTVVQNFDVARFTGIWHEIASYWSENSFNSCPRAQYTLSDERVIVENSQVVNQTLLVINGYATVASTDGSAKLKVVLEVAPNVEAEQDLWVLSTDYENYAVVYTCVDLPEQQKRLYSWIVGRNHILTPEVQKTVDEVVDNYLELNRDYYRNSDQSSDACFYLPEPVPNTSVVFRGSCDLSIPVVSNFDAARYLGLWHNVESYPSTYQPGTCSNAFYSLNADGSVAVHNTQVINETLDTIDGYAVVASTDGTAKLSVTFPVADTNLTINTNYWVIDTDYDTYSLVYSCDDLPGNNKMVFGWKLSRTKELAANVSDKIDQAMSTVNVLNQRYFVDNDQSEDGCFYYPKPQPGVPVVFPGQCDDSIPVVNGFNLNQFEGVWHEIEAYPKDEQPGQCINHDYTVTGNSFTLDSSQIVDQLLVLYDSTVTFTSNDGSAKLNIAINSNNTVINIPFWILDTDYSDYALAYSCVNINDDFKGIWSWKLSRSKELSPEATNKINTFISSIPVLDNKYYEPVDQSDEACFYLPEQQPGKPVILDGQCDPNMTVVQNFDVARFTGIWHEIASYWSENSFNSCPRAQYTLSDERVIVENSQVVNQTLLVINGYATVASTDGSAKLKVVLEVAPNVEAEQDLWVLSTDYENYAVVYTCVDLPEQQKRLYSWIVGRNHILTPEVQKTVDEVVDNYLELNRDYYRNSDQSSDACFYLPEPVPNTSVVFRGSCDLSIPVVSNFDAARYLGLWHNVESYPSTYQPGTCSNAFYSLNADGSVAVHNTQVINETLDTIDGYAVVASTDGTAKLSVTFPVADTNLTINTNYWVIDTDYDTYSLVYSCDDLPGNNKMVFGWKLSRTKELAANVSDKIDQAMSTVNVLNQRYFVDNDQSEDGCFYYPKPQPGVPVVFPGQCDDSIPVVNGFNLNQFEGVWHEIEAYPKEEQPGQCINHDYTVTGNSFTLDSSQIVDQLLVLYDSIVTFTSNDESAKLNIAINSNNTVINIPFWILDTDYSDYALAYSCVNINDDFKGIWSWKLSRSKQLSPEATNKINTFISSIPVLDNKYYEPVDQSDDACFYLPELQPGESVILVGQCDPNITVVQNFDAARYMGTWRMIESYPSDFQSGTCNDATYSLGDDGVMVYNTQVVNKTLETINGTAVLATTDGSAKLLVQFPGAPELSNYWVLDTDYDSYSLVYSCANLNNDRRRVFSWKLSRTRGLTEDAISSMNKVIDNVNVLNNRYYDAINQTDQDCFFYPEPDNNPVVFRGQCDMNISVVPSFDVIRYLGLWYSIASYPTTFQDGGCANAYYSANPDGTVHVFNSQVINETLDTIDGLAAIASDDGTAKLNVTFPIAGSNFSITTNYWVLDTDYDSYALVYTCEDIDAEHRMVFSWKLSRNKFLTINASEAIDEVIDKIQVLDDRYYKQTDHSEDGCFYFPEPEPDTPVVFPGSCDDLNVVQNFNLNLFSGVWYEIESYPKEETEGQCLKHDYTQQGNTFGLVSSQVVDKYLDIYSSQVTFASDDGSAKLNIVLNTANNTVINIPFWIIDTDYTNYALAYSCVSHDSEQKGVWSWKLSRSKQLNQEANAAIDSAMSDIPVIDDRYFVPVDQSLDACFYLPELQPDEPVIFVGQCDPNIGVVKNFDPVRYTGVWRLIDSYYTEFNYGACADATYTLTQTGEVSVYNTQVVNETLESITGSAVLASDDGSAKLLVKFPNAPAPAEYWVLNTDYENYALVYSCVNMGTEQRRVFSWKLSRGRELTNEATRAINAVIESVDVLDHRYYQSMNQSEDACFYYPKITSGSVIFRGQCDQNIQAIQSFDAASYLGQWYDIESYPQEFQTGTCPDATYGLRDDGSVDVFNTQVVDQVLDTINGFAVLASDDGSGKLNVTFPIADTNFSIATNYWILETDYISYSLVYSCQNIDDEYRRVSSWKLSRDKTLSGQAIANINNIITGIKVLDQRYYLARGHDDEDCFYYPDNKGGPVYLYGQCDDNITVVENFDFNAFIGEWYEVSRFPSEVQAGDCSASVFSTSDTGTVTLTQTIVYNERLMTMSGPVTENANGKGIIDAFLSSEDGSTIDIRFYVLDTDYVDYALVYSCNDITNETKQVYSWKFAKSPSGFSQASNKKIDKIVTETKDLYEGYYQTIEHTHDKCFYYPEYEETPPAIVYSTPCEEITAMADFNATAYLGKWYEIAKYPQRDQLGQCARAEYSLGNDGVIVHNTEVVNQNLSTIIGVAVPVSNGVLEVTFVIAGQEVKQQLMVLDTDYTSYSLVYACINLPSRESQVSSWKLSREKTLKPSANAIINDIIESTRGLLEDYYVYTSQTDDDCFYIPEVKDNAPVVFTGQCEDILGAPNFDIDRYIGWWHEIESYSDGEVKGDCFGSQFQSVGTEYQAIDTQVFGLEAEVTTAVVTATNNGRITKRVNDVVVQEYFVLATDYQTYSLVYSCKNIDSEHRQVWSAKYSKQRNITAEAQNAIAEIIQNNKVLYPQFFKTVDQTDEACFHYPKQTENRVVLPGQCDDNIPVQKDFDPVQYTGTWYQIKRYPQIHEHKESSCVAARYALNSETGIVSVLNWEVIDGILETIEGTAVLTTTNGDAKLKVTLPVVGTESNVTTSLYVLKTDYVVYSLVYSCSNLNEFERSVSVWKLSRTRSMPAVGHNEIEEYTASRQEFYEDYFIDVRHDDSCPEPSGAINIHSSILVLLIGIVLQRLL